MQKRHIPLFSFRCFKQNESRKRNVNFNSKGKKKDCASYQNLTSHKKTMLKLSIYQLLHGLILVFIWIDYCRVWGDIFTPKDNNFEIFKCRQKAKNFKKFLIKCPASNAWATIFKNADYSYSPLKVTKLRKFQLFFLFKILYCLHY